MTQRLVNPDTNEPIRTSAEFSQIADRLARRAAGLPEYDMDDPERPFTPEYDPPAIIPEEGVIGTDGSLEDATEPKTKPLEQKMAAILEKVRETAGRTAIQGGDSQDDPEDAWGSLGGGHNTYHEEGNLPVGNPEDAKTHVTRGRGGILVTRVELAGRFKDVPVRDGPGQGSNWQEVEKAKEQLALGKGTPTDRLRPRRKK